jgi:hypothetical protein
MRRKSALAVLTCVVWGLCQAAPQTSLGASATIERHALCMPDHGGTPDQAGKHWAWWQVKRQSWKQTNLACKKDWAKGFMVIGPWGPIAVHKHRTFGNLPDPSAGVP